MWVYGDNQSHAPNESSPLQPWPNAIQAKNGKICARRWGSTNEVEMMRRRMWAEWQIHTFGQKKSQPKRWP